MLSKKDRKELFLILIFLVIMLMSFILVFNKYKDSNTYNCNCVEEEK